MDGTVAFGVYSAVTHSSAPCVRYVVTSRRVVAVASKGRARARLEPPSVQILVVVASIQVRTSKAEVEKGSM